MNDKIVIITGAAGGIGSCLALGFHEKGYRVVALDRVENTPFDPEIVYIKVDLGRPEEIEAAFEQIRHDFGCAHILINNGAIAEFNKPMEQTAVEEWDQVLAVNLRGPFLCAKAFAKLNKGQSYGRIINMASTRWQQNEPNWECYGASKGGLVSMTNALCVSLGETPITVNAISPGWIETKGYDRLREEDHKQHPSGRVGKPNDILNACLFLAHEDNDFINGANLVIDGGMTKKMIYK